MKQKEISPVRLLLRWAGPEKKWLIGSVLCAFGSGLLAITAYLGLYRLMDAVLSGACTPAVIADCAVFVMAGTVGRMVLLGASGVLSHKGAYGALFRVRCMVTCSTRTLRSWSCFWPITCRSSWPISPARW